MHGFAPICPRLSVIAVHARKSDERGLGLVEIVDETLEFIAIGFGESSEIEKRRIGEKYIFLATAVILSEAAIKRLQRLDRRPTSGAWRNFRKRKAKSFTVRPSSCLPRIGPAYVSRASIAASYVAG
jgi:hypothetical protein